VSPAYQVEVVFVKELGNNLCSEGEGHTAIVLPPTHSVLVRVRPEQVTQQSLVWDVGGPHDASDLLHRLKVRTQSPVTTEDLLVHDGSHGQAVEAVCESLPQLDVVSPLAFVVEAVDPVDGRALVVPTEQEEVLGVLDLVSQEQTDSLQRLLPSVHVIPQEQVVALRREAAVLEQSQEVVVLTVDVAFLYPTWCLQSA